MGNGHRNGVGIYWMDRNSEMILDSCIKIAVDDSTFLPSYFNSTIGDSYTISIHNISFYLNFRVLGKTVKGE